MSQSNLTRFEKETEPAKPKESDYSSATEYLKAVQNWREETGNTTYFQDRQEARAERYEEYSQNARDRSNQARKGSDAIADNIPFGQPILVGHHSEKRARKDQERIHNGMRKCIDEADKADYYKARAETARKNKAINSDDEDAIIKLKAKIEQSEKLQERMKAANKSIRLKDHAKGDQQLIEQGLKPEQIKKLREPDFAGRLGFPGCALTNNNSNLKRMKDRLTHLEKQRNDETKEIEFSGGSVIDNVESNRVQIFHDEKPSEEIRNKLKAAGFRRSRYERAWQRKRSNHARYEAENITGVQFPRQGETVQETPASDTETQEPEPTPTTPTEPENPISIPGYDPAMIKAAKEPQPEFTSGQKVESVTGETFLVMEVFAESMTVRDKGGLEYDGLFETFHGVE